jgi:hypothetical protein
MSATVNIIQAEGLPLRKMSIFRSPRSASPPRCAYGQDPLSRIWTLCIGRLFLEQVGSYLW